MGVLQMLVLDVSRGLWSSPIASPTPSPRFIVPVVSPPLHSASATTLYSMRSVVLCVVWFRCQV